MNLPEELIAIWGLECGLMDVIVSKENFDDLRNFAKIAAEWGYEACENDNNLRVEVDWDGP